MADTQKLTVQISRETASRVHSAVRDGEYRSISEAVQAALQLWSDQRQSLADVSMLQKAWDAGKASGIHGPLDFDRLRKEALMQMNIVRSRSAD